ncbi:hypothetical protein [Arcanobacterium bovis]|uniref:Uncharacterized protein n=1 Tax=Arcanobacterium bovis TaxID=2529275 RepID=A0A4Q9V142_9ACTO|nr:hypothetical protein [Arcanobacterium bovis]TBW22785.1 hypothetical protein EZJ44_02450 [Arcanobacterium bovis]
MVFGFNKSVDRQVLDLCREVGVKPTASSEVVYDGGKRWLATSSTMLVVLTQDDGVRPGETQLIEWADFAQAGWDEQERLLTLKFIDPALPALQFELFEDYSENFVTAIRERVDRSIVYQQFVELSSGVIARGQVRRNADETLFTQILVDGDVEARDREILANLDIELREAVGL